MEVILLERVENLGQMGDVVTVKAGYARNFLLPQKKALRANENSKKIFENQRAELETRSLQKKQDAEAAADKLNGRAFVLIRQASETGALYGSVSTRDIADAASDDGVKIERVQVRIDKPLKTLGVFPVRVKLHPDVDATIDINIARSEDEAERQARGENVLAKTDDFDDAEEQNEAEDATPEFFDEKSQEAVEQTEDEDTSTDA